MRPEGLKAQLGMAGRFGDDAFSVSASTADTLKTPSDLRLPGTSPG